MSVSHLRDSSSSPQCPPSDAAGVDSQTHFGRAFMLAADPTGSRYIEAFELYQKAADQNHRLAQFNLGQMFAHGHGIPKDDSMAVMWIRRAANGGDAGAQFNLAERCQRASDQGPEMEASECRIESYKWYSLAAAQGYRDSVIRTDSSAMRMSREEVAEASRRVKTFVPA